MNTDITKDYRTSLPIIKASAVRNGWVLCPNCNERHMLFYRRHSDTMRTLNFLCDKVVRHNILKSDGTLDRARFYTVMGECEMVDKLPIKEEWTPKYRKSFQKEHHGKLI